ncbi:hypothetical protein [Succiniclasticum ruminis]|uniref:Uncharacterized protein n=1 Tax=Succiniclasticum ruminis DSM 9236 TaxID=1123323 RepID=A0A1I1YE68_9FIRM|nr:hypothetical protein [Succiniclasticum ruminis]SFE16403.1 hypothetical protein SAMN05216245_102107 [Succiniclasticum ruminis DSM 9236]
MKSWFLCVVLFLINNVALARPAMSDVYDSSGDVFSYIAFFAFLYVAGWIIKKITGIKDDSNTIGYGLLALIVIVGIVIVYGFGTAFIGVAKKYPLLAIAVVAFYWWALKKK